MDCQKALFDIEPGITYLNCASMSPMMKRQEEIGQQALKRKLQPYSIKDQDFFEPVRKLKESFGRLINCPEIDRLALIPSVSYGMANVADNIQAERGQEILLTAEQFPSNYYPWERLAREKGLVIRTIDPPEQMADRGRLWNQQILAAIGDQTALVAMANIHWTDGTLFDLAAIRAKSRAHNALLVIDGTQSIGALDFDIQAIQPDAMVCTGYKWQLGPYGLGIAYYGPYFDQGRPIEESWMNRQHSENFQGLVAYQSAYRPGGNRYMVGESSQFFHVPILQAGLTQVMDWGLSNIQDYCGGISQEAIAQLRDMGCWVEEEDCRARHLFGVRPGDSCDLDQLAILFKEAKIFASLRGSSVRIAPYVYNDSADLKRVVDCFHKTKK